MIAACLPLIVESEDAALMRAVAAGDGAACARLVREHSTRLFALASRMLRDDHDAADTVQDAFISAVRRADSFRGDARLSTWLHRITVNACLMRRRRERASVPIDSLLPTFDESGRTAGRAGHDATPDVLARLCRDETCEQVRAAIGRLPGHYREALLLRDIDGMDGESAAAELGISLPCLKIRLHRARAALRPLLEPLARDDRAGWSPTRAAKRHSAPASRTAEPRSAREAIVATSSAGSTGLATCIWKPARIARTRSSERA